MKLSSDNTVLLPGSLVLVTGASGFIATHIVDELLLAGYHVRGTVRTSRQVTWTTELFNKRHEAGNYSAVIVPDMSISGAFDEAVKGVHGIVHTASVVSFSPDPNDVIPQTIAGVTSLLNSAAKEPSVKSFVYTSSSVAATEASGGNIPNSVPIDSSTWNESAIKEAWSITAEPFPSTHAFAVYGASKAQAEMAFWKFVKDEKPSFQVNAVLPDFNFGAALSSEGSLSTGGLVKMVYDTGVDYVKVLPPGWYVDVDDTARLHVAALLSKSVNNERIFAFAGTYTWNDVLAIMRKAYPSKSFPEDIPDRQKSNLKVPNERGEQLLREVFGRKGWTSFEEVIEKNMIGLV